MSGELPFDTYKTYASGNTLYQDTPLIYEATWYLSTLITHKKSSVAELIPRETTRQKLQDVCAVRTGNIERKTLAYRPSFHDDLQRVTRRAGFNRFLTTTSRFEHHPGHGVHSSVIGLYASNSGTMKPLSFFRRRIHGCEPVATSSTVNVLLPSTSG